MIKKNSFNKCKAIAEDLLYTIEVSIFPATCVRVAWRMESPNAGNMVALSVNVKIF